MFRFRIFVPILIVSFLFLLVSASSIPVFAQSSFGTAVNLSNDSKKASDPMVANVEDYVYVTWTEGAGGILFRASADGGSTWSPPISTSGMKISPKGGTAQFPLITAIGTNVYITWSQTVGTTGLQVFAAASTNNGASFTVTQITSGTASTSGSITPAIAASGTNVYVVYCGAGHNSYVVSSSNEGSTWTAAFDYAATCEPEVAASGNNAYAVADGIQFALTHNAGGSWTKVLNQRNMGDEPMIAVSGTNVYIVSQSRTANGPIWLLSSSNSGNSFGARKNISSSVPNDWAPMVGAYGNSVWVAWHNNPGGSKAQEWVTTSTNAGSSWSTPLSISGTGHWVGWPWDVATTDGQNIFIMWPQQVTKSPNYWVVRVSYSGNGGTTWSAPPGIDASNNANGQAAPETDVANGAISSYGTTAFVVWQYTSTSGTNQIYFAAYT